MPDITQGLAIVGPGLIGTSVALAAKRRWPQLDVRTVDKDQPLAAIGTARIIVLAAPVDAILEMIPRLPHVIDPQALVIDTGSTKQAILKAAADAKIAQFVGGHPMAGGTSVAEARAELFDDRPWFLVNPEAPTAVRRAASFVEALGARPVVFEDHGQQHDRLMAAISHLPQVTASVLMATVAQVVDAEHLRWAGGGLRDTTRLAASGAAMWQGILSTNREHLAPLLKTLAADLSALADHLDDPDTIAKLFDEARKGRAALK
jgi:prephenate dehydrogenase